MRHASIKLGNKRLLRLADYIERRQRAKPERGYDQSSVRHTCGAPACAVGHAEVFFMPLRQGNDSSRFFGLQGPEWFELFGAHGCGNAGQDWREAVKYIRDFVARRGGV